MPMQFWWANDTQVVWIQRLGILILFESRWFLFESRNSYFIWEGRYAMRKADTHLLDM